MNAYELAKELDKYKGIATKQASDMLRQQSDRIKELEADVEKKLVMIKLWESKFKELAELSNKHDQSTPTSTLGWKQTSAEPTAWIQHIHQTGGDFYDLNVSGRGEPLYKHPPQIKELSDEEIDEIASMCSVNESGQINTREFARAILKKASEK